MKLSTGVLGLAIVGVLVFCTGCTKNLFDGKLDCYLGTELCLKAKAQYDACPTCTWEKVEGAITAVGYAKSVICASGASVVTAAACIPTKSQVDGLLDSIQARVAKGGGDVKEIEEIVIQGYRAAGEDERAAALEAVLSPE